MTGFPRLFAQIIKLAVLPDDITPHVLRHSFASLAADLGYIELTIASLLGHKGHSITSRYVHSADAVLRGLVSRPYRRLAYGGDGVMGAGQLEASAPDESWHAVRINGKRARYATETVAAVLGGEASVLASALAGVQELLGEHQDAAVAGETWLAIANSDPDDHVLAMTAGRLFERERAAVRAARSSFPAAWKAASRRRLTEWMR